MYEFIVLEEPVEKVNVARFNQSDELVLLSFCEKETAKSKQRQNEDWEVIIDRKEITSNDTYKQLIIINTATPFYDWFLLEIPKLLEKEGIEDIQEKGLPRYWKCLSKTMEEVEKRENIKLKSSTSVKQSWIHTLSDDSVGTLGIFKDKKLAIEIAYLWCGYMKHKNKTEKILKGSPIILTEGNPDHDLIVQWQKYIEKNQKPGDYIGEYVFVGATYGEVFSMFEEYEGVLELAKVWADRYGIRSLTKEDSFKYGISPELGNDMDEEEMTRVLQQSKDSQKK